MADWPQGQEYNRVVIGAASPESIGTEIACAFVTAAIATGWPAANLALFVPFLIHSPFLLQKIIIENGGTVSGNIDVGVYDDQQNRLVSSGSTAHAGTGSLQTFDVTDTTLQPGAYYMAAAMDGTAGLVRSWLPAAPMPAAFGMLQQATAFPLPEPAVFAACAQAFIPNIVLLGRTLV